MTSILFVIPFRSRAATICLSPSSPSASRCKRWASRNGFRTLERTTAERTLISSRSQMTPAIVSVWDLRDDTTDVLTLRKLISQWRAVSPNYYGNYYALTSYSLSNTDWAAVQFDGPEAGEGFVEIFRRSKSPAETEIFRLRGLDPAARYEITNLDDGSKEELSGKELLNGGIRIHLDHVPDSAFISYKKLD